MNLQLLQSKLETNSNIQITGSKSESNRLLILQALFPNIEIENLSNSDDTKAMIAALSSNEKIKDIHHAGTTMRFLTAYYAVKATANVTLTGSSRMKERPISILVDALKQLDASISYAEKEGYPPLHISGTRITKNSVKIAANVSSQYISALLLVGAVLENGLEIELMGEITSAPYLKMTLALLDEVGIKTTFENQKITIAPQKSSNPNKRITVESDWSSASYYFSLVALSAIGTTVTLSSYKENSLQGDSCLVDIYKYFGVSATFDNHNLTLRKITEVDAVPLNLDLAHAPDIAQTIAVTSFGLGKAVSMTGLHTLKIKETDRLVALKTELEKFGATVTITDSTLALASSNKINEGCSVATYQDHRMAMAFAPLALKTTLVIEEAEVVSKSYPSFWEDMKTVGIKLSEFN